MALDPELRNIQLIFGTIGGAGSTKFFPPLQSLRNALRSRIGTRTSGQVAVNSYNTTLNFATGSVEAWQRGLHSFLDSPVFHENGPIWA